MKCDVRNDALVAWRGYQRLHAGTASARNSQEVKWREAESKNAKNTKKRKIAAYGGVALRVCQFLILISILRTSSLRRYFVAVKAPDLVFQWSSLICQFMRVRAPVGSVSSGEFFVWEVPIDMDEGSSNFQGNITKQGGSTQLFQNPRTPENLPMVEEICIKTEDTSTANDNSDKAEGCTLKMDVTSPNGKMEVGSPKTDVLSMKMDVVSPKMEASSPSMDISSPNMEVSSPTMEVSSPNAEEGSAKMEEVAVKMGEVSVKSEERSTSKDSANMEQGSEKMEEVAAKMGEVSVKAEGNMMDDIPSEKGSVKMEEVSVKMEKVSVQSEQVSPKDATFKADGDSEKKIQHYRGVACVTEGEVPDWLTVDLLVRAIRNDKPGTKKPQIRPFGSPASKTRAASHGHPPSKVQPHQMVSPYNNPLLNRPSGTHMLGEPSTSHVARPSNSPSANRASSSQTVSRTSTSESPGKASTSQSSGNKLPNSQTANKPSSSCTSDSTPPERTSSQNKGKAGPGVRIKGKSSLSLNKGKAPAGEASSRASGSSVEGRDSGNGSEGGSSAGMSGLSDDGGSKSSDNSSEYVSTNKDCENKICDIQGRTSSVLERQSSNDENKDSEHIGSKLSDDNLEEKSVDCSAEAASSSSVASNTVANPTGCRSELEKTEALDTFKKPIDPPKRPLKKTGVPLKGAVRKLVDPSKDTFKKPIDPPKRTLKKPIDSSKIIKKTSEPPKVRFKKPEVSPKDAMQKPTETSRTVFKNAEESSKGTFKKPFDPPKHAMKKTTTTPKKPKQPPLQVIRFISQRLSSGNTVYRVRATAVRGSVARDCHLVVKRCSNAAEVTYYKKVAPRIPYVPRVLLCDKNVVVMDDLVHEGFRRPRGKFTPAQMTVAIDGLAHMHTASVVALKRDPSLLEAFPQAAKATESDIARDLRMLADRVKSWSLPDADYYAARCRALAECVPYLLERLEPADTNMTVLLHGNISPRNVFFLYDSRNPRLPAMASFVDFANVYWGHPALDISLVTGRAGGFWEGYKIILLSLLTRASGRMWMPQPEIKDCGETYAFALLRAVCSSVSGTAAKVLEARLQELFPVFRQYSWLDFW
ncbi:hypothetical protein R5R35_010286 [Gryllus longicercus]|uniref:CHK kinase-like domain-containing protein n=1 Tax=Gryllus longicercus TaxID=2509291 RepID=A0AAN9Z3W6_9ORTH